MKKVLSRLIRRLSQDQQGITGLETAIILIAMVVVASVFAYTMLSAGIFSAEKSGEAINDALGVAQGSMTIVGPVTAKDTDSDSEVEQIVFILKTSGSGAVDLSVTTDSNANGILSDEATQIHSAVMSYLDENQRIDDITWTTQRLGRGDNDSILEDSEKFQITVDLAGLTTALVAYRTFSLEFRPDQSSPVLIGRTMPAQVDPVMDLR